MLHIRKGVLVCSSTVFVSKYMHHLYTLQNNKLFKNIRDSNTNNDIVLLLQANFKPFKNTLVSILDCSMLFNSIFLLTTTWFFLINHQDATVEIITTVSISITFLAFLFVLFYHVLWVKGKIPLI